MSVQVDLNAMLGAGASLVVVAGGLAAGYVGLRRWVQRAATPAQAAADQLKTSNGTTVAGYIEQTAQHLSEVRKDVAALTASAAEARDKAAAAETLARHVSDRLDVHLVGHQST